MVAQIKCDIYGKPVRIRFLYLIKGKYHCFTCRQRTDSNKIHNSLSMLIERNHINIDDFVKEKMSDVIL
jgi:hypothetical protein